MILKRLFTLLWQQGVVLVTSSNRVPEDLYVNGIQRKSFLPFIPLLRQNCKIFHIDSDIDYRQMLIQKEKDYFARLYYRDSDSASDESIYKTFYCFTNPCDNQKFLYVSFAFEQFGNFETNSVRNSFQKILSRFPMQEQDISTLFNRNIQVMQSTFVSDIFEVFSDKPSEQMTFDGKIVIVNFRSFQEKNWGASDFLALCGQSPIILLDDLTQIDLSNKNLARRFILFIGNFEAVSHAESRQFGLASFD